MNAKILIIDDEDDIRALIQGILEDEGYNVISASNSDAGLSLINDAHPDLVIQDIWLQGSDKDGIEILKETKTMAAAHGSRSSPNANRADRRTLGSAEATASRSTGRASAPRPRITSRAGSRSSSPACRAWIRDRSWI